MNTEPKQTDRVEPDSSSSEGLAAPVHGSVELGRGYVESMDYRSGRICLSGWLSLPERPIDGFVMKTNGAPVGQARLVERQDVAGVFPGIGTALKSGFVAEAEVSESTAKQWLEIDIIGVFEGAEVARISTLYKLGFRDGLGDPPPHLMQRVMNNQQPMLSWCTALTSYREFSSGIRRHLGSNSVRRLLDWGCGCGRVVGLFLRHSGISEIHGCDIDPEGVSWCEQHLRGGVFSTIDPHPPTPYADDMFDVVIGYSVFTHLERNVQNGWLAEMRPIVAPGGLFLASCHGDFATLWAPVSVQDEVRRAGISDISSDPSLDGIAPAGYYRAVFQSREYTLREWSAFFDVVEHIPRGMGNLQDLVIMRKRH